MSDAELCVLRAGVPITQRSKVAARVWDVDKVVAFWRSIVADALDSAVEAEYEAKQAMYRGDLDEYYAWFRRMRSELDRAADAEQLVEAYARLRPPRD